MEYIANPANALGALLTPKVALSYLRVSSRGQAQRGGGDDEGFSIPAQREANKKKAAALGAFIVKEFVDRGASAKSSDREKLQAMLDFIREYEGKIDYVIVHKVDRLARNREDDTDIMRVLRQHGVRLVSTTESIDESPSGMLLHGIMSSIAEFYSRNLAAEVTKGMTQKAKGGGTVSKAPVGYINVRKVDEQGREFRTVELDEERAPLIKLAFELFATGEWTVSELAEHLATLGLTTRGTPKVPSKPMDKTALNHILVKPYYKGVVKYKEQLVPGKHQPLTDPETWKRVQDVLASHINGERTREYPHFLKSSVYCGSCGERLMIQNAKSRTGVRYPYFSCAGRHSKRNDCRQKSVLIEEVEQAVERLYDTIPLDAETRLHLEKMLMGEIQKIADEFEDRRKELEREKEKHERKQRKLLEAHYADAIPLNLFREEQTALMDAVAAIDRQLDLHETRFSEITGKLSKVLAILEDCGEEYRTAPEPIKRTFNQALYEKIFVCPKKDGTCEVKVQFAEPYDLIFGQEAMSEAGHDSQLETKAKPVTIAPTDLWGLGDLSRHIDKWRNRRHIFYVGGSSKDIMVDVNGLEPLTLRTSSECSTS